MNQRFDCSCWRGGGGGGGGAGGATNYVSVSRDRSDFQSLYGTGVYSIVQILGRS